MISCIWLLPLKNILKALQIIIFLACIHTLLFHCSNSLLLCEYTTFCLSIIQLIFRLFYFFYYYDWGCYEHLYVCTWVYGVFPFLLSRYLKVVLMNHRVNANVWCFQKLPSYVSKQLNSYFKFIFIDVKLNYSVVLISAVLQSYSVIHICI